MEKGEILAKIRVFVYLFDGCDFFFILFLGRICFD
jgi:hypothetical protein